MNSCKHLNEQFLFEQSNQDFLIFVIKYLSDDKENWQNEWVYDGRYRKHAKCVCGKEGIETVYVVRNEVTNKILSPIGSVCIDHFSHNIMEQIKNDLNTALFELLSRGSNNEDKLVAMTTRFFSKNDLKKIKESGVITDEEMNICLKALNKRSATLDIFRQANDILIDKILPALRKSINAAVASSSAESEDVYFDSETRKYFERIYEFTKRAQGYLGADEIEDFFSRLAEKNNGNVYESLNNRKKSLYREFKVIDSVHKNFYEARIGVKCDKKYLVLENHLIIDDNGEQEYSVMPLEVNVFEVKPEITHVDEILIDDDFENNFTELPEPTFICKTCDKETLKQFFNHIC